MRRPITFALTLFALLALAGSAQASQLIDRNATKIKLKVSRDGKAMVSYNAHGRRWDVLAWGAVNALHPNKAKKQVQFRLDRAGGWGTFGKKLRFPNACRRYDGPAARPPRHGLQGARRLLLGGAAVAARPPEPRLHPVAARAARAGAPPLALDRPAGRARGLDGLVVERAVPLDLRPADLPREAGVRLQDESLRRPAGQVRPARLPRHLRLEVRPGLAARELVRDAQRHGCVLLQLPPPQPAGRRLHASEGLQRAASAAPATARPTA